MNSGNTGMEEAYMRQEKSEDALGGEVLAYIGRQINKLGRDKEQESLRFLHYFGLDANNLRKVLSLEHPFTALSQKNYGWNDFYGKKATMDIEQYMRSEAGEIRMRLEEKAEGIIQKFKDRFIPSLIQMRDAGFAAFMLDNTDENSLYGLLCKVKKQDYSYLIDMNRQVYEEIQEEDAKARRGFGLFGRREEAADDIFESVDQFLQQRYEIYRYKTMELIYEKLLKILEQYNVHFPDGEIQPEVEAALTELGVYKIFSRDFLKTLDPVHFLTEIPWDELKERLPRRQEKTCEEGISLIIQGIQKKCLVVKKRQAFLSEYAIIGNIDCKNLSLKEQMELFQKLQHPENFVTGTKVFAVNGERDYESLLENKEFMKKLTSSLQSLKMIQESASKMEEKF